MNDKVVLDSNIVIAFANKSLTSEILNKKQCSVSDITRLEVMGFHKITIAEHQILTSFFDHIHCITISPDIISIAISYRRKLKMTVGDAIIAETAHQLQCPLYTRNIKDFERLNDIEIFNPFE